MSAEQDDHHNDRKMPPQTDTPATAATATDSTLLSSPFPSKDSSDTTPYPKAASLSTNNQNSVEASQSLQATDIAQVLTSQGPVVKCVLLRAAAAAPTTPDTTNNDTTAVDQNNENTIAGIEELEMDTTPKKQMVQKILGGPWTFLGQYEDEGLMLMIRKEQPSDEEEEEQPSQEEESSEEQQKPKPNNNNKHGLLLNQHRLQPPFDQAKVWGDILVLKVAATEDDDNDNDNDTPQADLRVLTNEEFFLDYTKEEYVRFSNRTDVVAPAMVPDETEEDGVEREDNEDSEEEEEEEEEEEDGDEDSEEEEEDEEESRSAIMNLVMGQVLRKFTEENGRGPDTEELLNIRSIVAQKFGMEMPPPSQEDDDDDNDKEEGQTEEGEHGEPKTTDDDNDTNTINNSAEVAVVEEKCAQTNGENVSKKRNLVDDEDNNTSSDNNNNKRVKFVVETVNDEDEGNTDRN